MKELQAVKAEMISQRANLRRFFSQNNNDSQKIIEISKIEELLQNQTLHGLGKELKMAGKDFL